MIFNLGDLTDWFERVYSRTLEVAQAVPALQLDWKPAGQEFSCGDIIRHIASTELMNTARLVSGELHYSGHDSADYGRTKAEVIVRLEQAHAQAMQNLQESGVEALERLVSTNQGQIAGWRVLVGMLEHEIHHRSQLCSYLSQLGIDPPPLYGLYVEELPA
jgi:uncharacterized damage-inducible protein DinB